MIPAGVKLEEIWGLTAASFVFAVHCISVLEELLLYCALWIKFIITNHHWWSFLKREILLLLSHECNFMNVIKWNVQMTRHINCTWHTESSHKLFDIQMICSYMTNQMTRQIKDHWPRWAIPASSFLSLAFLQAFAPNSLHHNARHVNQSSETEHSSPKEIICHQRMEELANPPFLSLLLLRARGVAYLLLGD